MTPPAVPFIVCGVDRSGLALLSELLAEHRSIAMSRRTGYWDLHHGRFGSLGDPGNLHRCLDEVLASPHVAELGVARDEVLAALEGREPSYGSLFATVQELRLQRIGKRRWGDKAHGGEAHAATILAELPGARMIHVLRDPRDRYASQATHRRPPRGGAASGAALWRWSARLAERNRRLHPEQYLVVRYEDLARSPDEVLRHVCSFVGEPFDPAMVHRRPLRTASIGRYRHDLTDRQIAVIDALTGPWLDRFGYEPAQPGATRTVGGRARLWAIDLPLGAATAAAWRVGQRSRRAGTGPRRAGRSPTRRSQRGRGPP